MFFGVYPTINVGADEIITSEAVSVRGFQIRTNDTSEVGVAFRTVCQAPTVGSVVANISGVDYRVKEIGTIYTLNPLGEYGANDTLLDSELKSYTDSSGKEIYYYDGAGCEYTKGFVATSDGIMPGQEGSTSGSVCYVRTLTQCNNCIATEYFVRAFVIAENESGDEIIVYGSSIKRVTIAEIADYLYTNSMASNYQGHTFLYNSILHVPADSYNTNAYYRNAEEQYGWNGNLYEPDEPVTVITSF